MVRSLVAIIDRGNEETRASTQAALNLLSAIFDPAAVAALREVAGHQQPSIRRAAIASLGRSGSDDDVALLASLMGDPDLSVRSQARAALAEIGGQAAAAALIASVPSLGVEERADAQAALGWLGDRRDYDMTRELAHRRLTAPYGEGINLAYRGWGSVYALFRIGTQEDRQALIEAVLDLARGAVVDDPERSWIKLTAPVKAAADAVIGMLAAAGHAEEAASARADLDQLIEARRSTQPPPANQRRLLPVEVEPLAPRTVPRLTMIGLTSTKPDAFDLPPAKFGGQPDWLQAPAWPLDRDGRRMVFYGQLPLPGESARIAYIFFSPFVDETWEPLSNANALVVQPGAAPQVGTISARTGPQLFERIDHLDRYRRFSTHRRYERFIELAPGADPVEWTWPELPEDRFAATGVGDWNKIGGTPYFLQGEDWPEGDGWDFVFQFTAGRAGHEFADGAECYGFVNTDGRGAFLWQCH